MALSEMEAGDFFTKWRSKRWKKKRFIELSKDHLSLLVSKQSCGIQSSRFIDIKKIEAVREGRPSTAAGSGSPDEKQCFSIVFRDRVEPLHLVANTEDAALNWVRGIRHLSSDMENLDPQGKHSLWIREHFRRADKDANNLLSFKEVKKLLNQLNFEASQKYIELNLKEFDVTGDQCLSFEEFTEFFKKLTWRPEIERLYKTYCDADLRLQPNELCRFFRVDQGEPDMDVESAIALIQKYEPDSERRSANEMTIYGFTNMLLSQVGDIFKEQHKQVTMDMTQPLCHYFIASSHNTYLTDDQLFGKSSVESYIRALERGCRCVELDCWDGDDGEPIIYHGYTLTSKIKFVDVIQSIRDYAFKASPYPVILSIENHCSVAQQTKMAEILKSCLGSSLLTLPVGDKETILPSPEQLKGKVLVKGKRLPDDCHSDGEVSDEDEAADVEEGGKKKKEKSSKRHIKLSLALSGVVVYAISRHMKNFDDARERSDHRHISSLNEDRADDFAKNDASGFVSHTSWQLVRVYPRGSRTNSSNYNPLPMWNMGCQIVALNYQTTDMENCFNEARFRSNGGCGYVLKPSCLLADQTFNPLAVNRSSPHIRPIQLTVRIISAQQLPKHPSNKKDVIDPYVIVSITGCKQDQHTLRTHVIDNNGFNPSWVDEASMQFTVLVPSLAFLQFKVMDKDSHGSDDLIGFYILPIDDVATGYRHVHLQTVKRQILTPATLFVNIAISDIQPL